MKRSTRSLTAMGRTLLCRTLVAGIHTSVDWMMPRYSLCGAILTVCTALAFVYKKGMYRS